MIYLRTCWGTFLLCLVLTITNKVARNIHIQVFIWTYAFGFFHGKHPGVEWVGCGEWYTLSHLRNCQIIFQGDCTILHFPQQRMRVPLVPHAGQHSVCLVLILDIEHLSMCFFAIHVSSLLKSWFKVWPFFCCCWFDFFSSTLYFGHKSKGCSFRYKFICFPGMWNQKNKIKLRQEKSIIILKEVLFDCEMNVGTGATKGGCKTFPVSVYR